MAFGLNLGITVAVIALALFLAFKYFPFAFNTAVKGFGIIVDLVFFPFRLVGRIFGFGRGRGWFPTADKILGGPGRALGKVEGVLKADIFSILKREQTLEGDEEQEEENIDAVAALEQRDQKWVTGSVEDFKKEQAVLENLAEGKGSREDVVQLYDYFKKILEDTKFAEADYRNSLDFIKNNFSVLDDEIKQLKVMLGEVKDAERAEAKALVRRNTSKTQEFVEQKLRQLLKVKNGTRSLVEQMQEKLQSALKDVTAIGSDCQEILKLEVSRENIEKVKAMHTDVGKRLVDMYNLNGGLDDIIVQVKKFEQLSKSLELEIRNAEVSAARAA